MEGGGGVTMVEKVVEFKWVGVEVSPKRSRGEKGSGGSKRR